MLNLKSNFFNVLLHIILYVKPFQLYMLMSAKSNKTNETILPSNRNLHCRRPVYVVDLLLYTPASVVVDAN